MGNIWRRRIGKRKEKRRMRALMKEMSAIFECTSEKFGIFDRLNTKSFADFDHEKMQSPEQK